MQYDIDSHAVPVAGAYNIRDLGNYPVRSSGVTTTGIFYRSDSTAALTPEDVALLKSKEIRLVVDLRSRQETEQKPSVFEQDKEVQYVNIPMLDDIHSNSFQGELPHSMGELYVKMLDGARQSFGEVFRLFARQEQAVLFHCTAGKDRTGIVSMLLLLLADVADDVIIADYTATDKFMEQMLSVKKEVLRKINLNVPDYVLYAKAESMETALAHLRDTYQTAKNYLLGGGVLEEEVIKIVRRFSGEC